MLVKANRLLEPLGRRFVFLGGATVHLHVDDPAAAPVRTTKDVDVAIAVANYADFCGLEDELRENGFEQTFTDDGPICRWTKEGLLLDILPTKPEIIGFSESLWFEQGFIRSLSYKLGGGEILPVFDVLYLLAAKIDAFKDRGEDDLFVSQDFEDIATILDGSTTIWARLAADLDVAIFIREWLSGLDLETAEDAIAGHVGSQGRARLLIRNIRQFP
jgi:predicted nucleotidyltransferase